MLNVVANGLVVAGAAMLVGSLVPVRRMLTQLRPGAVVRRWYLLTVLTAGFIAGYIAFLVVSWGRTMEMSDLLVPAVFFFGACFVWLTFSLSLQTAIDMRRVTLLELESITDPLTGLHNRRFLDRRLREEYARVQRYANPLSILMIDVDRFKEVNDTCGHHAGDEILGRLGNLIQGAIRPSDTAARYGGDEIVVVAGDTPAVSAAGLAERLRRMVEAYGFAIGMSGRGQPAEMVHVTVSIGVAGTDPETASVEDVIRRADEALYRAKSAGRNRVVVNSPVQVPNAA